MALDQSALLEVLDALKAADVDDRIRSAATTIYQALIEAELTAVIGAAPHERTDARTAQRNGSRPRTLSTTAGDLELRIPKLRAGSFFPSLLERRRRIDQALFAVVMEAYLHGVSTRKVDDLVRALGADTGISKSEVSRICADLDAEVSAFADRSLAEQAFPYVFLDATYCKARVNRRVVSQAVVIATGVAADGHREVLGFAVGDSEDGAFWTAFLRSLKARGLGGTQLVISDAHAGLKAAISAVLLGAAWQRCRVHFMRNVLARVPKGRRRRLPQPRSAAPPGRRRSGRSARRMAGLRPPLPLRRLHGTAQPTEAGRGGGAAGPDGVIVTTPLTNTVRTTSTTQRDVTFAGQRYLKRMPCLPRASAPCMAGHGGDCVRLRPVGGSVAASAERRRLDVRLRTCGEGRRSRLLAIAVAVGRLCARADLLPATRPSPGGARPVPVQHLVRRLWPARARPPRWHDRGLVARGPRVPAAGISNAGSGANNWTVKTAARTAYGVGNVDDQRRWVRCACTGQLRWVTVC
jgi:putative transposase